MKNKKVAKLLALSALTGVVLGTTGCAAKDIIDAFDPANNQAYIAYGPVEMMGDSGSEENK